MLIYLTENDRFIQLANSPRAQKQSGTERHTQQDASDRLMESSQVVHGLTCPYSDSSRKGGLKLLVLWAAAAESQTVSCDQLQSKCNLYNSIIHYTLQLSLELNLCLSSDIRLNLFHLTSPLMQSLFRYCYGSGDEEMQYNFESRSSIAVFSGTCR